MQLKQSITKLGKCATGDTAAGVLVCGTEAMTYPSPERYTAVVRPYTLPAENRLGHEHPLEIGKLTFPFLRYTVPFPFAEHDININMNTHMNISSIYCRIHMSNNFYFIQLRVK